MHTKGEKNFPQNITERLNVEYLKENIGDKSTEF